MRSAESYAQEILLKRGYLVIRFVPGPIPFPEPPYPRRGSGIVRSRGDFLDAEYLIYIGETDYEDMRTQVSLFPEVPDTPPRPGERYYRCVAE